MTKTLREKIAEIIEQDDYRGALPDEVEDEVDRILYRKDVYEKAKYLLTYDNE